MNIVVVGVGDVGYAVAEALSHFHNVMVVDNNRSIIDTVKRFLNASILFDDGTNPRVLEDVFKKHSPDVIISATDRDGDNLFIAMISKYICPNVRTIARIKNPDFMTSISKNIVDQIISPEIVIANKMAEIALIENAVDYESIESMGMCLAFFEVTSDHKNIIGKVVISLKIPEDCTVVSVHRSDEVILDSETTEIRAGDKLCVLGNPKSIREFNEMMGVVREASEFVIIGGGVAGHQIAKILESNKKYVKLFEPDSTKCAALAKELNNITIVNGSGVDPHLLKSENVGNADVLIAITNADETNLLACLMGMKLGVHKVMSRYSTVEYEGIFDITGIKMTTGTHRIVVNEITKMLVSNEKSILKMKSEGELFFSVTIGPNSKLCDQHIGDLCFPNGARVACIMRENVAIYPRMDTKFLSGDVLLMFTYKVNIKKLETLLGTTIKIDV
ncbi:MAG: NAD-binding protein [archaeon]|nr:NAD-binding protein [archaeon]